MRNLHPVIARALAPWAPLVSPEPADPKPQTNTAFAMACQHYAKVMGYALQCVWDRCDLGQDLETALIRAAEIYGVDSEELRGVFDMTKRKERPE